MFSTLPITPATPECQAFIANIQKRTKQAERKARFLPRTERQAFIYDNTFRNEIEAVAYPLAKTLGRIPDFRNPVLATEKTRNLYLTHPNPLMSLAADKASLPHLCAHLDTPIRPPQQIAVFDDPTDFNLSALPETAMIKVTDGCKMNILHGPGLPVTPFAYRFFLWKYWHVDHWRRHAELHYRDIPRRVLVEEALLPVENIRETGVFCAFGEPYMAVTKGQYTSTNFGAHVDGMLAFEKHLEPLQSFMGLKPPPVDHAFPPSFHDAMLDTARQLATALPHCRVDFMLIDGRCYLGEVTISPMALCYDYTEPEQQKLESDLFDLSRLPEFLDKGKKIADALGWPTEPSFGHFAPDDPRLATGGR